MNRVFSAFLKALFGTGASEKNRFEYICRQNRMHPFYMLETFILLALLGLFIGTVGTLIGAGGGFILVPVLILFYPELDPNQLTGISLAVVAANAIMGSSAYSRMGRIDYKTGLYFALGTIPGSIIGVMATLYIPSGVFNLLFGTIFILLSIFLLWRSMHKGTAKVRPAKPNEIHRQIKDSSGRVYKYAFNLKLGMLFSVFIGFFSPLLGIGGGIIQVPVMSEVLRFPVHIATATSQFTLAIMAMVSVFVHIFIGDYSADGILPMVAALICGVIPGSLLGARISQKLKGQIIIRVLAVALILVGIRIIISAV